MPLNILQYYMYNYVHVFPPLHFPFLLPSPVSLYLSPSSLLSSLPLSSLSPFTLSLSSLSLSLPSLSAPLCSACLTRSRCGPGSSELALRVWQEVQLHLAPSHSTEKQPQLIFGVLGGGMSYLSYYNQPKRPCCFLKNSRVNYTTNVYTALSPCCLL